VAQPKERSTTQRRGRSTKPRFASGSVTTSRAIPSSAAAISAFGPVQGYRTTFAVIP
jgi:hypothetical protein